MGVVLECAKLVSTSWLYRNWDYSNWKLKVPLIIFTLLLMFETCIGVFGYLSKAHLQQSSSTINNLPKIENIDRQIQQEKTIIVDNEKVINQLDATVNSFLSKDRIDKSLSVRKNQTTQRTQLKADINESNKKINQYTDEKLKLLAELKEIELEVGPLRYISELFFDKQNNKIEDTVKLFTLLIVLTLDPLAIILLIAANHTILRMQARKPEGESNIRAESDIFNVNVDETVVEHVPLDDDCDFSIINDEIIEENLPSVIASDNQKLLSWIERFKKGRNG
jgi:hypothetical protein